MASRNPDAVANQGNEFHAARPRDEPLTTSGVSPSPLCKPSIQCHLTIPSHHQHKPGVKVGNDAAPEFHAKTLPPGSAPADRTFQPNPVSEVPGQALNDNVLRGHGKESTHTTASSTLGGSTSADVYQGLGKPLQGQTNNEAKGGTKKVREGGLVGVGSSEAGPMKGVDERVQESQRGLEKEEGVLAGKRGDKTEVGAEELPNVKY